MNFIMNNRIWRIEEVPQDRMREIMTSKDEQTNESAYYGLTIYYEQKIYIWDMMCPGQKRQTLMHELMHCYIASFIDFQRGEPYSEEAMCNISANSHDIIDKIVTLYFSKDSNEQ